MCGIYGYLSQNVNIKNEKILFDKLSSSAEIRGQEACGFSLITTEKKIIQKFAMKSSIAYGKKDVKVLLNKFFDSTDTKLLMGHSRLQTHGDRDDNLNNQPLVHNENVMLHNGIVCNFENLFIKNNIERETNLDSEYLIKRFSNLKQTMTSEDSLKTIFKEIEGEVTISLYEKDKVHFATNCGNLYYVFLNDSFELVFASEKSFLELDVIGIDNYDIKKLEPQTLLSFDIKNEKILQSNVGLSNINIEFKYTPIEEIKLDKDSFWKSSNLQVCSKGILNQNMPGISFDHQGVSNFAKNFKPFEYKNLINLENKLLEHKKNKNSDIVVGFSGGRDSSYMLHLLKTKYNMNPIAITYDWGMVTDLARRNQARICGALGIEHVIVAADIPKKRSYIKKYLNAWLKKPHLGMVPLLMAGDKKYFQAINETAKKNNIDLVCFGSAPYEFTSFKTGFAGVVDSFSEEKNLKNILQASSNFSKLKLSLFYLKKVLENPYYLNNGLIDAVFGFKHSYIDKKDYLQFFEYEKWDENNINNVLINEYGWETDPSILSTWRIGDGTAPFYNFIYKALAGFSEHDTFRNNQTLSGVIDRETALNIASSENEPRFEKIEEYLDLIDVDYDDTINKILEISPYK